MIASDTACKSMHIYAHPFLPAWLNHCRLNLFLQMLSLNKLWKKDSLKRRDMVKESWAYYTPKSCLGGLMLCIWYVQTRWSPPCDLGTINKHIKELNHKFALHIDSSWLVAFQHLYVNTKDLPWKNDPCSLPLTTDGWEDGWEQHPRQLRGLKFARLGFWKFSKVRCWYPWFSDNHLCDLTWLSFVCGLWICGWSFNTPSQIGNRR